MWTSNNIFFFLKFSTEDNFTESYQCIQQLKTPDTQDTDVSDLLPLLLTYFIRGKVKIFLSWKACLISNVVPIIEQLSIFNPIYLALFIPQGQPEHYDVCIPSKMHAGTYQLQTQKEAVDLP